MHTKIKELNIEELEALISNTVKETMEGLIEDILDVKVIEEREKEPGEDYEAYSRRRKSRSHV